jgi:serine/threonine-protein kinase
MFKLNEVKNYSLDEIRKISQQLNTADENPEYTLDCSGIYGIDDHVLEAIFSSIRDDWKEPDGRELDNFMTGLNGDLLGVIKGFLNNHGGKVSPLRWPTVPKLWLIGGGVGAFLLVGLLIKSLPYLTKTKLQQTELMIGTLLESEDLQGLVEHIEDNSVPANYFEFLKGNKVKVLTNGDRSMPYSEAENRINLIVPKVRISLILR